MDSDLLAIVDEGTLFDYIKKHRQLGRENLLKELIRLSMTVDRDPVSVDSSPDIRLDAALLYNEIGSAHFSGGESTEAIRSFERALAATEKTRNPAYRYVALHSLGLCYMALDEYGTAVRYFQLSAQYANFASPTDVLQTLEFVALCWQRIPAMNSHAYALYDWICVMQPTRVSMQIAKFECQIASGEIAAVQNAATIRSTNYADMLVAVAANEAIGAKRRARERAREGQRLAIEAGEAAWEAVFAGFLNSK